jgi:hypothetical protein
VEADIATATPRLAPGSRIGFHDYGDPHHPDVRPVVDEVVARGGWRFAGRMDDFAVFAI